MVGGHARNVGKTSMVAGLIEAFSDRPWTAVKISSHRHSGSNAPGGVEIQWETSCRGDSDTSRYLAAGAARSLWVQSAEDCFETAVQRMLPMIRSDPFLIFEGNRIMQYVEPDLCLMVLRYDVVDFKESAREMLARVHAAVACQGASKSTSWEGILPEVWERIPIFAAAHPQKPPAALLEFIQARCPGLRR